MIKVAQGMCSLNALVLWNNCTLYLVLLKNIRMQTMQQGSLEDAFKLISSVSVWLWILPCVGGQKESRSDLRLLNTLTIRRDICKQSV